MHLPLILVLTREVAEDACRKRPIVVHFDVSDPHRGLSVVLRTHRSPRESLETLQHPKTRYLGLFYPNNLHNKVHASIGLVAWAADTEKPASVRANGLLTEGPQRGSQKTRLLESW